MTLQELLNSDVGALGGVVRQGWDWWIGELAELVPERWRRSGAPSRPVVELAPEALRMWRQDHVADLAAGAQPGSADLALPPDQVLIRTTILPALGAADLKRLVALELDRLTPFRPDQVYFDLELRDHERASGRRSVRLAVVRREVAEAALERAQRRGLSPLRLGVLEEGRLRFDFLPTIRAAGRGGRADHALVWWWSAAAALMALNLGLLVWKDVDDTASLRRMVDLQRPSVGLAMRLRQRVEQEDAGRRALLARRAHNEPLHIEDAVGRTFPAPQWIQRMEWNGRTLRLVGYRDANFDVLAAMRKAKDLGAARTLSNAEPAAPGAKPQFDLVSTPPAGPRP